MNSFGLLLTFVFFNFILWTVMEYIHPFKAAKKYCFAKQNITSNVPQIKPGLSIKTLGISFENYQLKKLSH